MSDQATETTEAPKKKKSKLPIFVALIVLMAGGGFFVLKTKGGGPKKPPKIELAAKETELEEFLTNTSNPAVYVRAKFSITLIKDYEETKLKDHMGDVRDAVLLVLNSTAPADITDASKRPELKKTLDTAMNKALADSLVPPDGAEKKADAPTDGAKDSGKSKEKADAADPDWDSQKGPVMKVRFTSLATQ